MQVPKISIVSLSPRSCKINRLYAMSEGMESEDSPFLGQPLDDEKDSVKSCPSRVKRWLSRAGISSWAIAVHLVLIMFYSLAAIAFVRSQRQLCARSPNAMTDLQLLYKPTLFTPSQDSPFTGEPSPESDHAWHDLMENMTIRVSREELEAGDQTSVALPEGGFMAWLGVFHELHCVKMLREWKYRDHYHPNLTEEEVSHKEIHADHCLEMLRSASMCHTDLSLTTFKWDRPNKPMLDTKRPIHMCADWQTLMSSMRHRLVTSEEVRSMQNPTLGA